MKKRSPLTLMSPHQKHYRAKMKQNGWMDEGDETTWPPDVEGCEKMARGLFGIELVSNVDYWTLVAEDELDGTHQAPWAGSNKKTRPEEVRRREIFKTLNPEQREAVRDLLRCALKGELFSFCVSLDQTLGGSTISIHNPNGDHGGRLEIHSPSKEELHHDQYQWLEDFSIVFGKDERY
jgi:hypothetical protein